VDTTVNAKQGDKVDLKGLAAMPHRVDAHGACPGCGIFSNLDLFLRGIDGHVALIFNTGCGMVVTTGFPATSFRVPYFHNLFHNGSSTATGVVEMVKRMRRDGRLKEDVTVVVVTGDGGDDIGMDQVIAAALRNDPFIILEYDNKGYMNTGGQLCYTDVYGQIASNAPGGKRTHHKDVVEILRGTRCDYLFHASESHVKDMIQKARRAQATVRAGGFAFGKVFSFCPLNWGADADRGNAIADLAVRSCLHPLYEVVKGKTRLNFNPEKSGKKVPVKELFAEMGKAFAPLLSPEKAGDLAAVQAEVDARWARLVAMDSAPNL
jgi:pyruvate ferredoxin oxidoreductase alpha subunit